MDSDSEYDAIFAWLKRRMLQYPDEFLEACIPSPQKPVLHKHAGFLGVAPKLDGIGSARTLHDHALEEVASQRAVSFLE